MFTRARRIEPEILDDQTPEAAEASLRDLVRINSLLGGTGVLRRVLEPIEPRSFLDVGAASGDAAAYVRERWPATPTVSLDYRLHHVRSAPGMRVVADAFTLPFRAAAFDVVYCGLFLHHFSNEAVVELLMQMHRCARRYVVVNDLERHILPWLFLPATAPFLSWDKITLHDGPRSVQAGFSAAELGVLARAAGLVDVDVRTHRPSFRLSAVGRVRDDTLPL